jgi:YVTN family beta-propeller protein
MQSMTRRVLTARLLATTLFVAAAPHLVMPAHAQTSAYNPNRTVGPQADGSIVVSSAQTITPAGQLLLLGRPLRAKAVAVNPNPKSDTAAVLLMGGPEAVVVFNTVTGAIVQNFASPSSDGSFKGITYSADGTKLFFSQDNNHFVTANVDPTTGALTLASSLALPTVSAANPNPPYPYYNGSSINPASIVLSPDGTLAYVALNAANTLGVINLATSTLQTQIAVGNAPNSVVVSADGHYAYVSNEGGRKANPGEYTNASDGAAIVADPNDAFAITGTVSVVDLTTNTVAATIDVGLHPAGLTISGTRLYVTNAYSDTVSVVDLNTNKVVSTIDVGVPIQDGDQADAQGQQGQDGNQGNVQGQEAQAGGGVVEAATHRRGFGSGPNGIIVEGRTAYVTLGQANAIAVVDLSNPYVNPVVGYIPTAYFPTSIAYDAVNKQLVIADSKGVGVQESKPSYSSNDGGTVNLIPLPNAKQLAQYTEQVINNNHWSSLNPSIFVGPEFVDRSARPVPIPKHIGEPSVIKHVFLIIKENRTYDAVLGDLPQGNGDPALAVVANAAPNLHALVKRFPLLDNAYAPSWASADGHNWIVGAGSFYSNDNMAPDWIRAYPYTSTDALTYNPRGFLWSAAQKKGLTVKLYGEYSRGPDVQRNPATGQPYAWGDFYNTALCIEGKIAAATCATLTQVPVTADTEISNVPSAAKILDPHYPSFDLTIPDQYRVDYWLPIFNQQVATNTVPNLTILWLPDDHTGGAPLPAAQVADNDLAVGRVVEAISHSNVWGESAIFSEEDDASDDYDHVDGHRMTSYVFSPWTAPPQAPDQGKVVHTIYTQENINRTIEQILGFEPLTQFDLVASPMFEAFGEVPDFTPYTHVPATVPLNEGPNGTFLGWSGLGASFGELELTPLQKAWIEASGERTKGDPLQKAWIEASNEMMKDKLTKPDAVDPNFMSHAIWYSATDWKRPYPGDTEIKRPDEFLKAAAQKVRADDDDDDKPLQ